MITSLSPVAAVVAGAPPTIVAAAAALVATLKAHYPPRPVVTLLLLAPAVVAAVAVALPVVTPSLVLSLQPVVAMVLVGPTAQATPAAVVVLVVVVPLVVLVVPVRREMPVATPSTDRATVVVEAEATARTVETRMVAASLLEMDLVEVTAVTAHRLRLLGLPLHEQAAVVGAASARARSRRTPDPVEQAAVVMVGTRRVPVSCLVVAL